jgi:hypothetical protein
MNSTNTNETARDKSPTTRSTQKSGDARLAATKAQHQRSEPLETPTEAGARHHLKSEIMGSEVTSTSEVVGIASDCFAVGALTSSCWPAPTASTLVARLCRTTAIVAITL